MMSILTSRLIHKFICRVGITTLLISAIWGLLGVKPYPAVGQLTLPDTPVLPSSYPPANVERFGGIETAPVRSPFFVKELFRVAAPTVYNRDGEYEDGHVPVELRAELIEANLRRAMSLLKDAETVRVSQSTLNGSTVLQVSDQHLSRSINLLTVTDLDASFNAQSINEVAKLWRETLQQEFVRIVSDKENIKEQIFKALRIVPGIVAIVVILQTLHWFLRRHDRALKQQMAEQDVARQQTEDESTTATLSIDAETDPALAPDLEAKPAQDASSDSTHTPSSTTTYGMAKTTTVFAPSSSSDQPFKQSSPAKAIKAASPKPSEEKLSEVRSRFVEILNSQLSLRRQRRLNRSLQWLIFWAEVAVLYIGAIWITSSVTLWYRARVWLLGLPIDILLVAFGSSLAIRVSHWLIHQLAESSQGYDFITLGESERRRLLRITTISGVSEGIATTFFVTVGIIFILESLGVPTQSILAGGAVLAFAISFGSQSLVKDIITGCFILLEDQYAVGDVVGIGDVSGLVETLNLRVTQLRDGEGQLITIPNSSISQVKNLTRLWSRVDFTVTVAYDTDPKKLINLLQTIGADMYSEPEWADKILEPPTVMGIDELSHEGMLVRVWIKTKPLQQWATGREFRYRVRQAFDQHGIQIGKPQWVIDHADLQALQALGASQSQTSKV